MPTAISFSDMLLVFAFGFITGLLFTCWAAYKLHLRSKRPPKGTIIDV